MPTSRAAPPSDIARTAGAPEARSTPAPANAERTALSSPHRDTAPACATSVGTPSVSAVTPSLRCAASLVVLRERASGMEVLLLRRAVRATDFSSDAYVFPGGVVDAGDRHAHDVCHGLDDAQASARLSLSAGGLDYYAGAIRECFEETGLLLAVGEAGHPVSPSVHAAMQAQRDALHDGQIDLRALCHQFGVRLAADQLTYLSHWVTPQALPKRFDTRFFLAMAPDGQQAEVDHHETAAHRWLRPEYALTHADQLRLLPPARKTLQWLSTFSSAADAIARARTLDDIPRIQPRLATGRRGRWPVTPDEPAWAEVGLIDPQGLGTASYEIVPARAVTLLPGVVRVTASNPGMMTGPGTNTYLIGNAQGVAVIDPGPDDPAHIDAILAAAAGPIRHILVTHTHRDHSPAARALQARTGATTYGMPAQHAEGQDVDFTPDVVLADGDTLTLDEGRRLRAVHTPGHAANHLCYWLDPVQWVFTGDHVMQGSTVVINPPDGHMATYLASLRKLRDLAPAWLAPGHGFAIQTAQRTIDRLLAHRLAREARVVQALKDVGAATAEALVPLAYADTPPARHRVALRSLTAHLDKLAEDGRATVDAQGVWRLM